MCVCVCVCVCVCTQTRHTFCMTHSNEIFLLSLKMSKNISGQIPYFLPSYECLLHTVAHVLLLTKVSMWRLCLVLRLTWGRKTFAHDRNGNVSHGCLLGNANTMAASFLFYFILFFLFLNRGFEVLFAAARALLGTGTSAGTRGQSGDLWGL